MTGRIRTGIAGWVYEGWRKGAFYPEGLKQKDELHYASRALTTIEINSTFYSHQKATSFQAWAAETPEDFVFPVKGHQGITHIKRLKEVGTLVANFVASGPLALGKRLGPFVWQLPPNMKFDGARIEAFLKLLPQDPDALLALAKQHDEKTKAPFLDTAGIEPVRHAIEVRHESFAVTEFVEMMRAHNVAIVIADADTWPTLDLTADFAYCRLQGAPGSDHYEPEDIERWAQRVRSWADGKAMTDGSFIAGPELSPKPRDVFVHFVSTDKEHAPRNAVALAAKLA